MAQLPKVDVVTVGAGWTGGILAQKLTEAGLQVVSIEQGPWRTVERDFVHNHDELRFEVRKELMVNLSNETWTWRPSPRHTALPMRQYGSFNPGSGVGGAGVHWAAQSWRFYPSDFQYRTHHIERYGEDKLPPGNRIQDWPITYEELEPYYDAWEYDIGVSGKAGNIQGQIQEGGNPFEGPRQREYPLPPLAQSIPADMFTQAARELGYHPFPQPTAILSQNYTGLSGRERSGCIYCGFCVRYGCEINAKASALTDHIPMALATGRYEIRTGCYAIRINVGPDGLATGITYVDPAGREQFQPADIVILSAYTLSNVRLLLLSRDQPHPNGVGNDRGLVGKNYTYQLGGGGSQAIFRGRKFNQFMGNGGTGALIHDFEADNFDHSDLDFIGGGSIGCGGTGNSVIGAVSSVMGPNGKNWGAEWKQAVRENWDSRISIGIQGESLPYEDQYLDLDPNYRDRFGLPLLRITFDWHENDYNLIRFMAPKMREILRAMGANEEDIITSTELQPYRIAPYQSTHNTGGAIMGTDPGNSVTNKYGQVWDTPNVFVTGAALFPQNPGMNPTETVCALAYLAADGIINQYLKDPGRIIAS
ncbi:MAG TPA: GMC family oxidoreductase [Thermomicrobiales bacterium]